MHKYFTDRSSGMVALLKTLGDYIRGVIRATSPDYIVPIETKGAVLLDLALQAVSHKLVGQKVIYSRAFDYMPRKEFADKRFLVVDDTFFTGRTLKDTRQSLLGHGCPPDSIATAAFLDFANRATKDFHQEIHRETHFPALEVMRDVNLRDVLLFVQNDIIHNRMPSTYDHLLFKSTGVSESEHADLLEFFADTNRLLYYGNRGAFQTSSILLDDICQGTWSCPPKIRLWYRRSDSSLRMAPMAFPTESSDCTPDEYAIRNILAATPSNFGTAQSRLFEREATSLSSRVATLKYFKPALSLIHSPFQIDDAHLCRYFPLFGPTIRDALQAIYESLEPTEPPCLADTSPSSLSYVPLATRIITLLKEKYLQQAASGLARKDFHSCGYSVSELMNLLQDRTREEIHAALDYCFDMSYVTAFYDMATAPSTRLLRTTEIGGQSNRHEAEILAAHVVYSQRKACPSWLLNKVFPIIQNTTSGTPRFDDWIAVRRGPFGDISLAIQGEGPDFESLWSKFHSDLWRIRGSAADENTTFVPKPDKREEVKHLLLDPRIRPLTATLDAACFLCSQAGYKGTVLLDVLTGRFGGMDYLARNIEGVLHYTSQYVTSSDPADQKKAGDHLKGLKDKLSFIREEIESSPESSVLQKLRNRCSRLTGLASAVQAESESILSHVRHLPAGNRIYGSMEELATRVESIKKAAENNDEVGIIAECHKLAIPTSPMDQTAVVSRMKHIRGHIQQWGYALSGAPRKSSHYRQYVTTPSVFRPGEMFVLAYDLKGDRRSLASNAGRVLDVVDEEIHRFAQNWIAALGGRLSSCETNSGDLRYGFFRSPANALSAACWMDYHSRLLSLVNPSFAPNGSMGVALARGFVGTDVLGNLYGSPLDVLGHVLKGSVDIREIAGKCGRPNRNFERSNVYVIDPNTFPLSSILPGTPSTTEPYPMNVDSFVNESCPRPWLLASQIRGGSNQRQ